MLALGHENYLRMAVNLAASLKACGQVKIHLIHTGGLDSLSPQERSFFDSASIAPYECWHTDGKEDFIKAKTRVYDLSPFQRTLYLDVDMVWLLDRDPNALFDQLKGIDFTIMNEGPEEKCLWADPADLRASIKSDTPMYVFYSELLYFEKNAQSKAYFKAVKLAYDKSKIQCKQFAGSHMPDELAFIIASLQTGIVPHKGNWLPIFWYLRDKKYRHLQPYQLSEFFGYSIGGNYTPPYVKAAYNNLVSYYGNMMGVQQPYQVRDKRSYIPDRKIY